MKTTFSDFFLHIAPILGIHLYFYCKFNMTTQGIVQNMNKQIKYEYGIQILPNLLSIKTKVVSLLTTIIFAKNKINFNGSCYDVYRRLYGSCINFSNYFKTLELSLLNAKI